MNGRGDVTAGQIVELEFLVPFYHAVAEGEVLTIDLPGFSGADTTLCIERKSLVLSPWFERASWNVSTSVLAMTSSKQIPQWTLATVKVPVSFALVIPLNGLEENHPTLRAGGQFQAGPTMMTSISKSSSVFVLTNRSLQLSPPMAAVEVTLVLQFRHSAPFRPLRKGEVVTLLVHGLSSPKAYADKIQMNGQNNPFEYARWDSARGRLYLEFGRDVIGELVQASIPDSEGFRVSTRGLRENETFILLDEKVGPAIPNNLNTLPIGYLGTDARITFEDQGEKEGPPKFYAGRPISPIIVFTPSMDVVAQERIEIWMPGFKAPHGLISESLVLKSLYFHVSWSQSTEKLTLEVKSNAMLRAYEKVLVQVLINAGISLPVEGLPFNSDMLKISSNAKFGPVFPTHLACMQSVGSFTNTSRLSFSSLASPGLPSSFRIAFSAQMVCCSVHCAEPLCTLQTQNKHILYTDTHTHTH
jgi:hypothetical protein